MLIVAVKHHNITMSVDSAQLLIYIFPAIQEEIHECLCRDSVQTVTSPGTCLVQGIPVIPKLYM